MPDGGDLPRRALEALAIEEFRNGRLTRPELRRLLGFETGDELDGFLKAHEIHEAYTLDHDFDFQEWSGSQFLIRGLTLQNRTSGARVSDAPLYECRVIRLKSSLVSQDGVTWKLIERARG